VEQAHIPVDLDREAFEFLRSAAELLAGGR